MLRKNLLAVAVATSVIAPGCKGPGGAPDVEEKQLLGQVKANLAQRDGAVSSYKFTGETTEGSETVVFDFAYRAPNRMRGSLKAPTERTFSFDGEKLHDLAPASRALTTFTMKMAKEKNALVLAQTFGPFVAGGFRAPLFDDKAVKVKRIAHPKAVDAVELRTDTKDETGAAVSVTHHLRYPSMDFLGKTTEAGGNKTETRVEEEHCLERPKICFPKRLTQWSEGKQLVETKLDNIDINGEVPVDSFKLVVPEGYEQKSRELVDAP